MLTVDTFNGTRSQAQLYDRETCFPLIDLEKYSRVILSLFWPFLKTGLHLIPSSSIPHIDRWNYFLRPQKLYKVIKINRTYRPYKHYRKIKPREHMRRKLYHNRLQYYLNKLPQFCKARMLAVRNSCKQRQ